MSESLRDVAENHFNEALSLMQKDQPREALIELDKAEEAAQKAEAGDIFLHTMNLRGQLLISVAHLKKL